MAIDRADEEYEAELRQGLATGTIVVETGSGVSGYFNIAHEK